MKASQTVKDCPFCRDNNLLGSTVIATSANAYLIENNQFPGSYLIVPSLHIESLADLPDMWWSDVKTLLAQVPNLPSDYNLSLNIGRPAGQTIKHLHLWIVPRLAGEPASGKGLARLIAESNASKQ
jgi:diadenosine tetraphosphate (Ap4A) HIT family hydrolase